MTKILTSKLLTESGENWHTEPTCPTLLVPRRPDTTFSCFRLHHPQTQRKSIILNSSYHCHKKVPFMSCTTTHAARIKLGKQNIIYRNGKLLSKVEKRKHQTMLHSQLTKHWRLLTYLWRSYWRVHFARYYCLAMWMGVMTILPTYPCNQIVPSPLHIVHERAICHNPPIHSFKWDRKKTWQILKRLNVMFLWKYKRKHKILIEGVFLTQLSSNKEISVWWIVWVTTNCCFVTDIQVQDLKICLD